MIYHGVYLRMKPTRHWLLMTTVYSAEEAQRELDKYVDKAKADGHDKAEGAIQSFDSPFHIPEFITNIKRSKVLYN